MSAWFADVRFAWRQLRRSPGFAFTVVLTLALGVGANAVVFSVLNALVLRPLPVPQGKRLVFLNRVSTHDASSSSSTQSYPDYRDIRDQNRTFSGTVAYRVDRAGVSVGAGAPMRSSWFVEASENYFDVLGVRPLLGRYFHPSDARGTGSAPFVVLSYRFWRSAAHGNPGIVGRTMLLSKQPFTVIGVAPEAFAGTDLLFAPDFWVPLVELGTAGLSDPGLYRDSRFLWVLGRLKGGVSQAQAQDDMHAIARRLSAQYKEDEGATFRLSRPGLVGEYFGGPVRAFLFGVILLAGLVLLAACANLGSLFAARAADRSRELALRLALGASRAQVARQLLTEALLISAVGGGFGFVLADMLLRALTAWRLSSEFPFAVVVNPDWRVAGFALLITVGSGLLFGLTPLRQIWRGEAYLLIKSGPAGGGRGRRWTLRDALLVVQIVLCAVLLTSSLVSVRGLARSLHADLGFDPDGVLLGSFDPSMAGVGGEAVPALKHRTSDAVSALPGVVAAGLISGSEPLSIGGDTTPVYRDGTKDLRAANIAAGAQEYSVTPGYFGAARTKLIAGRDITWQDEKTAPRVAVVNETFAKRMLKPGNAVGQHFVSYAGRVEVVGLTKDGKYGSLTEEPTPAVFFSWAQNTGNTGTVLVVRTRDAGPQTVAAIRAAVRRIDPSLPVNVRSWREDLGLVQFPAVAATAALGVMGGLAAMLAVTGIFGMASYAVSKRMRELGLRVALGAGRGDVVKAALGRPARLLLVGSVVGIGLGAASGRLLAHVVYQASAQDPVVLLGVVAAMAVLALMATWVPARRALRADPALLLREE